MSVSSSPESHPVFSTQNSPPIDLKHMTSNNGLVTPPKDPQRLAPIRAGSGSQHLQTGSLRLGSRSPSSIPSSPTSVHSSSSAIFERDIEPLCPSPPHPNHQPNPHRIPRSKATEQLEQSVPSVLDSAAEMLTGSTGDDDLISVVAPAPNAQSLSGFTSPIGSYRSRSPSPTGGRSPASARPGLLFSTQPAQAGLLSSPPRDAATSPTRPVIQTHDTLMPASAGGDPDESSNTATTPSVVTPTSEYFTVTGSSSEASPKTTTREYAPELHLPTSSLSPDLPPSPNHVVNKRLSFMSYSDLLASTPAAMQPLSSLTTSASADPPPHIPSVTGLTQAQAHAQGHSVAGSINGASNNRDSIVMLDDIGGEWERTGMGLGLEERLDALMTNDVKA